MVTFEGLPFISSMKNWDVLLVVLKDFDEQDLMKFIL